VAGGCTVFEGLVGSKSLYAFGFYSAARHKDSKSVNGQTLIVIESGRDTDYPYYASRAKGEKTGPLLNRIWSVIAAFRRYDQGVNHDSFSLSLDVWYGFDLFEKATSWFALLKFPT
jgi:hypothetical protein